MASQSKLLSPPFHRQQANVNIKAIAQGSSEYNITVLIDQADSERALRAVHSRFYLSSTPIGIGLVGPGLIGSALLDQIREQVDVLLCFW
jgi:aspartokinase/homoserine dehydrogenase 1